jgi:hypothetical protein
MKTSHLFFALTLLLTVLVGCPPADDDDSAGPPVDDGVAPVVTNVVVCETTTVSPDCPDPAWEVEFQIWATDEDCDLNNPSVEIMIEAPPSQVGRGEFSLECGGRMDWSVCDEGWVRGADISYQIWVTDEADHQSEPWQETWLVPQEGEDDCSPL